MELIKKLAAGKEKLLFVLIICFSILLYMFNINLSDIWIDDSFTKEVIKQPFSNMLAFVAGDFHPPLYFIGLKSFTLFTGITDFTIRLFSIFAAVGIVSIAYTVGQRVFGKTGALYFCLLLVALPMTESYSHDARMYTWAAFFTTGVFLYAYLYMQTCKRKDLVLLGIFTLAAAYTHYYSLLAAFWANVFVLIYLISQKKKLNEFLITASASVVLFLPWAFILFKQVVTVKRDFWVPPVDLSTLYSCLINPFARKFWILTPSIIMIIVVYGLTLLSVYLIFIKRKEEKKLLLGLALAVFYLTILTAFAISVIFKPILYPRYIMTIVPLLMVPSALFFMSIDYKWLKGILLAVIFCCGVYVSISASYFSMGPYRQTLEYIHENYPEVKKILHINEVTAGPLAVYSQPGQAEQYWLQNKNTVAYTNVNVFTNLHQVKTLDEMLNKGEIFCLVNFKYLTLNSDNLSLILSSCKQIKMDEIIDKKSPEGIIIEAYILQYN